MMACGPTTQPRENPSSPAAVDGEPPAVLSWRLKLLCAAERRLLLLLILPLKTSRTLWSHSCWLPWSDTPQRGSDICLRVALSSRPVTGSLDRRWKLLLRGQSDMGVKGQVPQRDSVHVSVAL